MRSTARRRSRRTGRHSDVGGKFEAERGPDRRGAVREQSRGPHSDLRFVGEIHGHCRVEAPTLRERWSPVYPCRSLSISSRTIILATPAHCHIDQDVLLFFELSGVLRARVSHFLNSGFAARLQLLPPELEALNRKIAWLKKRASLGLRDQRAAKRVVPRNRRSVVILGNGDTYPCSIIDQSVSGVAVHSLLSPAIGTPLAIGCMLGRVVRLLDAGFAVRFFEECIFEDLEMRLRPPIGSMVDNLSS